MYFLFEGGLSFLIIYYDSLNYDHNHSL